MDNKNAELISGLMDNELSEFECHKAIQSLAEKANQQSWARYHLIGDAMRKNVSKTVDKSFTLKEMEDEPALNVRQSQWSSLDKYKPLLGAGMAAGIAAIAIYSLNFFSPGNESNYQLSTAEKSLVAPVVQSTGNFNQVAHKEAGDQLSRYITNHNQYTKSGIAVSNPHVKVRIIQYEK